MQEFDQLGNIDTGAIENGTAAYAPDPDSVPQDVPVEEAPDYAAMLAERDARLEEVQRKNEAYQQQINAAEHQRQQVLYQQAQQAWKQREQQLIAQTSDYDSDTRLAVLQEFYNQQINQVAQAGQQAVQMVSVHAWADQVIRENGLKPEDRIMLGNDPNQMQAIAARLKAERDEYANLRKQVERGSRAQQAQQHIENGINRIGGVGGRPAPVEPTYQKGSPEHLRELWNNPQPRRAS